MDGSHILVDVPLMGGIVNSLANPNQNQTALVNGCSTGNCTFPMINGITHSTIGMCSQCIDITSELQTALIITHIGYVMLMGLTKWPIVDGFAWKTESPALNASGGFTAIDSILSQVEEHDFTAITPASVFNVTPRHMTS
jgi:hypothetical protein